MPWFLPSTRSRRFRRSSGPTPSADGHWPARTTYTQLCQTRTLDLFAALNVATGKVIAQCKRKHQSADFVDFLREIDKQARPELQVHVVLDNLSAHKSPVVKRWLLRNPRFQFHFTPTYSSWLNLVERFFGLLTEEALKRGSHTSIPQLRQAILDYVEVHNVEGKPFKWTKTPDEILEKMRRFGLRTQKLRSNPNAPTCLKKSTFQGISLWMNSKFTSASAGLRNAGIPQVGRSPVPS